MSDGYDIKKLKIFSGRLSTVKELVKIPDININAAKQGWQHPTSCCCRKWYPLMINYIVTVCEGNADVMAVLITAPGASLAVRNKAGKTAEQLAR